MDDLELMDCFATRDEIITKLRADVDQLRDLVDLREQQLRDFAESTASASGFFHRTSKQLLSDLLG